MGTQDSKRGNKNDRVQIFSLFIPEEKYTPPNGGKAVGAIVIFLMNSDYDWLESMV